jgi:hypothetical protein
MHRAGVGWAMRPVIRRWVAGCIPTWPRIPRVRPAMLLRRAISTSRRIPDGHGRRSGYDRLLARTRGKASRLGGPVSHYERHVRLSEKMSQPSGLEVNMLSDGLRLLRVLIAASACVYTPAAIAQSKQLSSAALGHIVDAVISEIIPPEQFLSTVRVADRRVYFDHQRTLAAFHTSKSRAPSDVLALRSSVKDGTAALLSECDELGRMRCQQLGWSAYVWMEPISVSQSRALIRAHVNWPERGKTAFERGVSPAGNAFLAGFTTELQVDRAPDGTWRVTRRGVTATGD